MVEFCGRVLEYTEGFSLEGFAENRIVYDATLRNLELIGEAAAHVPVDIRQKYSNIPWRMIVATRNQLIHAYLGVDDDTFWSIIQDDVPELVKALRELISNEKI